MQTSLLASVGATGGGSPIDACVRNLGQLHDEGFQRVWLGQLPYEPDLLTVLAVVLREVDGVEVGTGVLPIRISTRSAVAGVRAQTAQQFAMYG